MHYAAVLDQIHQRLLPRVYVEIGVHHGDTLSLALPCTGAIGVDPRNQLLVPLNPNARLETCTSDHFFEQVQSERLLAAGPVDMAFVDGMHLFEFALRDVLNVERLSGPDAVIFMHDCLPTSSAQTSREQAGTLWTGDVWKALWILATHRPDVDITVVEAPPTGLAMIQNLDPDSTSLDPNDPHILEAAGNLPFSAIEDELLPRVRMIEPRMEDLERLLPPPYQVRDDLDDLLVRRNSARLDTATRLRQLRHKILGSAAGRVVLRARRRALNALRRT